MAVLKCKMCGGSLDVTEGMTVCECEYCGTTQTIPQVDDEKKITLFTRANRLRAACEFDKAASVYENIVSDFPEEAEAYWGLILCKFGIEYVDDPATGKKIPTCHRSSFESIMDDSDFEQCMENADPIARRVYREEAKTIDGIQKGILEISGKEEPYDIFICYKETDDSGNRTVDSVMAQDIYDMLTANKYRVFFARISLEDKLGTAYEPYIFAALNSARIMLAVGTDYEYYNAVWVKNEWSRFLAMMSRDKKKVLIPCYKGIDAYDIPKEFKHLQAQDMGKVGAMQDLLRGIKKIFPKETAPVVQQVTQVVQTVQPAAGGANVNSLLQRSFMFLEDGDWKSADQYCEKVLDIEPKNGEAYLGKLMAELKVRKREDLGTQKEVFDNKANYQKILRFGNERLVNEIKGYLEIANNRINERIRKQREEFLKKEKEKEEKRKSEEDQKKIEQKRNHLETVYQEALFIFEENTYNVDMLDKAAIMFSSISSYKNSTEMINACHMMIKKIKEWDEKSSVGFQVEENGKTITITKYTGSNENVVIPMTIVNKPVTKIGNGAFKWNSTVQYVGIPDTVNIIGESAFESCDKLKKVLLPNNLRKIEKNAFYHCPFEEIDLPNNLEEISYMAFTGCDKLKSIIIPESVKKLDTAVFYDCKSMRSVEILCKITDISWDLFRGCKSLTEIHLPETITSIGPNAFRNCQSLQSIYIPESVESIKQGAFSKCDQLRNVTGKKSLLYKSQGKCQYCGGEFAGVFKKKCTRCGREKDYNSFVEFMNE